VQQVMTNQKADLFTVTMFDQDELNVIRINMSSLPDSGSLITNFASVNMTSVVAKSDIWPPPPPHTATYKGVYIDFNAVLLSEFTCIIFSSLTCPLYRELPGRGTARL
jgi:hypothetical protein